MNKLLFTKDPKKLRKQFLAQLDPLVVDDSELLLSKHDLFDLMEGVFTTHATWSFEFLPTRDKFHILYQAKWMSPILPDFEAQLTITEKTLSDPSKWNCTARLEPGGDIVDLYVSYDGVDSVTMTYTAEDQSSDVHYSIVHKCPPHVLSVLNDHSGHFDTVLANLAASQGAMNLDPYHQLESDSHKKQVLAKAQQRLLTPASIEAGIKPIKFVDNGDKVPDAGGDRALWLAKQGALNVDYLNGLDTDNKKAHYIHKCDLRYAKHLLLQSEGGDDTSRVAELSHKIDVLTQLMAKPTPESLELAPKSTKTDPHEGDALRELHNNDAVQGLPIHTQAPTRQETIPPPPDDDEDEVDAVEPISKAHADSVLQMLKGKKKEDDDDDDHSSEDDDEDAQLS